MKVAIYVTRGFWPAGEQVAVSGHVQPSLKTAEILVKRGHDVTFITNTGPPTYRIPLDPMVKSQLEIKTLSVRSKKGTVTYNNMAAVLKTSAEIRAIIKAESFDILHFFGFNRSAYLLGLLKLTGVKQKSFMTMINYNPQKKLFHNFMEKLAFPKIDCFLTSTDYIKGQLLQTGVRQVYVTGSGVMGYQANNQDCSLTIRPNATDLVLFWRDAEFRNGADICAEAFKKLSPEFESVDFVFAVRPDHEFEEPLRRLDQQYANIHLLLFPYDKGITITKLIDSASCVVLPFRSLTCNPQLAVLETIMRGTPLITTPIESNSELVNDRNTVFFVNPSDVEAVCDSIRRILEQPQQAQNLAKEAQLQAFKKWNWISYEEQLMNAYHSCSR